MNTDEHQSEEAMEEMKQEAKEIKVEEKTKPSATVPAFMAVLSLALGLLAFIEYQNGQQQQQLNAALVTQKAELAQRIDGLEGRSKAMEENTQRIGELTSSVLQDTQKKFSSSTRQLSRQQQEAAKKLSNLAEQQGTLDGDMKSVKGSLDETKQDVSTQSGLIALNHDQLQELKRKTERDFLEFNLRKSKSFTRVGDLSLRLTKTDKKRQKYNMVVLADDRSIEKKDKTAMEPVQFYMPGDRRLLEVVVWSVDKDHVTGYVSVPKAMLASGKPGGE
jgi:hypothetical protein